MMENHKTLTGGGTWGEGIKNKEKNIIVPFHSLWYDTMAMEIVPP